MAKAGKITYLQLASFVLALSFLARVSVDGSVQDPDNCSLSPQDCDALNSLTLDGLLSYEIDVISYAAVDFGLMRSLTPAAVLHPGSVQDIMKIVNLVRLSTSNITVAARGPGHSTNGQSQALNGIIVEMSSLKGIIVNAAAMYVEAAGGELWVDVLQASLSQGLSPRSFTDYLYLSVGGTLSNAGISGQSFRYGPQINNVLQLEIITGMGELIACSREQNADLFYAALGGLGQFGIITKASIILEQAPTNVRWIRALYSSFAAFKQDQEYIISESNNFTVNYLEGFIVSNTPDHSFGWNSVPFNKQTVNASLLPGPSTTSVLYYIEMTINYGSEDSVSAVNQKQEELLQSLDFIPTLVFTTDVSYFNFLDRVHGTEVLLRSLGEWIVPHPWVNLFVPESKMDEFDATVLRSLSGDIISGPIIVYPFNANKWDALMTAQVPDEKLFYLVAFLESVLPFVGPTLQTLLSRNSNTLRYCNTLGCKQYLPKYSTLAEWQVHFGESWSKFLHNKRMYDPHAILAPGQNIFRRNEIYPVQQ